MDPEIKAMSEIAEALAPLGPEETRRVLAWANGRYLGKVTPATVGIDARNSESPTPAEFADLADLVDAARPATGLERILVGAYWFQVMQHNEDFDSQSLNSELKHMGYPSTNITRDLDSLINRVPKLVIQTRKEGTAKQARKRFRLTREGIRSVENLLRGQHQTEE